MAAARKGSEPLDAGPPTRFAEGPPTPDSSSNVLPLTAVLDITRNIGSLSTGVENLTARVGKLEDTVHTLHRQMYAALVLVTVIGGLCVWILDKVWDAAKTALVIIQATHK